MKRIKFFVITLLFVAMISTDYIEGQVYIAGQEGDVATLWINGVVQNLTDGNSPAKANSVYVSDEGDV
ncbi:MAG: hypothetical protein FWF52_00575, partial [Candidatus Azobacteroides sp.]|nr:hypothetical protein [Candidatus Azobacteroides sp.]